MTDELANAPDQVRLDYTRSLGVNPSSLLKSLRQRLKALRRFLPCNGRSTHKGLIPITKMTRPFGLCSEYSIDLVSYNSIPRILWVVGGAISFVQWAVRLLVHAGRIAKHGGGRRCGNS